MSEEAVIAAASVEAIALGKSAVKFAKAAARLLQRSPSLKFDDSNKYASEYETLRSDVDKCFVFDEISPVDHSAITAEIITQDNTCISYFGSDELDVRETITVRSMRQNERRCRRGKMDGKAAANVISVKFGSYEKKKHAGFHEVDYSDPLRYIRNMISTTKLLTASEEQQLSKGIQVKYFVHPSIFPYFYFACLFTSIDMETYFILWVAIIARDDCLIVEMLIKINFHISIREILIFCSPRLFNIIIYVKGKNGGINL